MKQIEKYVMHYAASAVFLSRKGRTDGQSGHSDRFFRETRGRIFVKKKKMIVIFNLSMSYDGYTLHFDVS